LEEGSSGDSTTATTKEQEPKQQEEKGQTPSRQQNDPHKCRQDQEQDSKQETSSRTPAGTGGEPSPPKIEPRGIYVIAATSTTEPSFKTVCGLLDASISAIKSHQQSADLLVNAARLYGAPQATSGIGIIMYFDHQDPSSETTTTTSDTTSSDKDDDDDDDGDNDNTRCDSKEKTKVTGKDNDNDNASRTCSKPNCSSSRPPIRWAGGFLVDLPTFQDAQQLDLEANHQQQSQQDEKQNQNEQKQDESSSRPLPSPLLTTLKAFRLGSKAVVQARIPWRSQMTPLVAHWLH
jgi:hypothetical protein